MKISDGIGNSTGCFVLRINERIENIGNSDASKIKIDVRADISSGNEERNRNLVIERLKYSDIKAEYSVHKATKRIMIRLYDQNNGKLIREIPAKKMLDAVADIIEHSGVLLDKRI